MFLTVLSHEPAELQALQNMEISHSGLNHVNMTQTNINTKSMTEIRVLTTNRTIQMCDCINTNRRIGYSVAVLFFYFYFFIFLGVAFVCILQFVGVHCFKAF